MSAQEVPNPGLDQGEAASTQDTPTPSPSPSAIKTEPVTTPATPTPVPTATPTPASNGKASESGPPAEICVVIGGSRSAQAQGSYVCGICGKKYKYYNCFQTHVRAHRESEGVSGDGASPVVNNSFRYTCDVCGKKYKYYSCFQEHRDLHAVDDPYDHVIPVEEPKEEVEGYQKIGPKTGSYTCEFCGKQYKYFNPYQEHVALHTPLGRWSNPPPVTKWPLQIGHSFDMQSPRSQQKKNVNKYTSSRSDRGPSESSFVLKMEGKMHPSAVDGNSQSSTGAGSPLMTGSFGTTPKPYTCGACGIQFQFYNNLMEHMQSHAADNENHSKVESSKSCVAAVAQDQVWKSPQPAQRNHTTYQENRLLPEKERQQVSERLLRLMCADLGLLSALNSKDFLKLAQTLVDTGSRHGAYNLREALGSDLSLLALRQLPRMYNQVKVKVTCALGSSASHGIAVTCHSQAAGPDACYVLTAYQVEGGRPRRYVLGIREAGLREGPEQVHHWAQNVLSEFVMSEMRTVYVTEGRVWASAQAFCGRGGGGVSLRCAGCSLGAVVQAVLGRRSLQARGLHELGELLATCRDIASTTNFLSGSGGGAGEGKAADEPAPSPPCWDPTAEALLKVHEHFEAICEAYGRSKWTAPLLQGLNKHMLGTLACLLAPLRQAALELGSERRPTLQQVLPVYLRLEKLFTAKAGEAGAGGSKLCHYFLEALKEQFKVERAHQVAMVLDPQLKLRPALAYQHDDIMGRVCEMALGMKESGGGGGGGGGGEDRDCDGSLLAKRGRVDGSGPDSAEEAQVRKELFQYLAEPLFHATPDLFQYWNSAVDKFPRLARLALWLLAVPAVGVRSECVSMCQQSLALKRKKQVTAEEMNKLVFLKVNTA
ncbi:zinc finger protein 618 [Alosa sapidissima]|uniref:zinc finger protein 618 n=1 Tax=Alosa sapidissima TaxID=34773 RepID=UPI001C09D6AD|nr:zinc finger protein 618 [Alosa sapidissima]